MKRGAGCQTGTIPDFKYERRQENAQGFPAEHPLPPRLVVSHEMPRHMDGHYHHICQAGNTQNGAQNNVFRKVLHDSTPFLINFYHFVHYPFVYISEKN